MNCAFEGTFAAEYRTPEGEKLKIAKIRSRRLLIPNVSIFCFCAFG